MTTFSNQTRTTPRQQKAPPTSDTAERATAAAGAIIAALLAGAGMLLLRSALQVRTVPERLMEWLLLFLPPGLFEAILQRAGFDAKRYALSFAVVALLVLLAAGGYKMLRRGWPIWAILSAGFGLWLVVMLVVLPLTSAGAFASELVDGKRGTIGGYLAVSLTYAAVLGITRILFLDHVTAASSRRNYAPVVPDGSGRRWALGLAGGALGAYAVTFLSVRLLPRQSSLPTLMLEDPQEPVPSGGLEPANPHPNVVGAETPLQAAAPTTLPRAGATPSSSLPEPSTSRQLSRDKDGAVLPSGRKPGEPAPAITPNEDFYIVTKNAGGDPTIRPSDWRLLIDGDVQKPFQLDYPTLRRLPAVEITRTLECISNFVGKPHLAPFGAELISTARWKGVRVQDILALAGGTRPEAAWVAVIGADEYTSAVPVEALQDPEALLVYEMNGEVLPREHGYPVRLLVPDRYGMKNPKWVVGIRPMKREFNDWYGQRNWSKQGLVRTMTRIDAPAANALLAPGEQLIAGVAYSATRGIAKVEFSSDGGTTWREAELETNDPAAGRDRWVRWRSRFTITPGATATLVARATDGSGAVQLEAFSLPEPDGGTGWPSIDVKAN